MAKLGAKPKEERIAKVIAQMGICSRRKAEALIKRGKVSINGIVVRNPATKINPVRDLLNVEGELVEPQTEKIYIVLNKPRGFITSVSDPEGRPTVMQILPPDIPRIYPVGRLDWDSEGLLILTNDGEFTNALLHPSNEVTKTYEAKVKGVPSPAQIIRLKKGVLLKDAEVKPLRVKLFKKAQKNSWIRITITSGKKHIVKRVMSAVGLEVLRLKRVEMAGLSLGSLGVGKFSRIKPKEIKRIWAKITSRQKTPKYIPSMRENTERKES
ncbi:MAG: pseudouridine synthase [Myxococcota bacterium]